MSYIKAELRELVRTRAGSCCEYCLLSEATDIASFHIDHVIAQRHRGTTEANNLCLSCADCNTFKGTDISSIDEETGLLTPLFNPRTQQWTDHFRLDGAKIEPLTAEGRVTAFLLYFNSPDRVEERLRMINEGLYPCQKPANTGDR